DGGNRTVYVGLDALDLYVAQRFAREGHMPVLARLLEDAASQETVGPLGFFVSANWPTIYTGTTVSRHGFLCGGEVQGGTYNPVWRKPITDPPAIWDHVSRQGGRVAVIDPPHAGVSEVNGVFATEWGCHDRHAGTASYPESFAAELDAKYGQYEMSKFTTDRPHYAPCDIAHRTGRHRTVEQNKALLDDLLAGHDQKRAVVRDLIDQGGW